MNASYTEKQDNARTKLHFIILQTPGNVKLLLHAGLTSRTFLFQKTATIFVQAELQYIC